ncbi:glycosyltransferase family 2 protein [Pedobacter steynii]|uniref:Glycosyltransferase 2-like domain-containing protein n=1 Tax=Pedobacter steynii TaxID=430522 RepID=A0A1D7QBK5_9SPHI|nr:glycosyltransferase [Pedobacter steynii]AOM76076.1 hypothetical protein BFS30_02170 [Pedobacter steynii]
MLISNKSEIVTRGISCFLNQNYPHLELIMIQCGGLSVGVAVPNFPELHYIYHHKQASSAEMRNKACAKAKGEIIIHWTEDAYYAKDWVTNQVNALIRSCADISGLNKTTGCPSWLSLQKKQLAYPDETVSWITDQTLCYWKRLWTVYPFKNTKTGESTDFITNSGGTVYSHHYSKGYQGQTDLIPVPAKRAVIPLVSCIMATSDSEMIIPFVLDYFLYQDYPNVELIIIDDGKNAAPELILHCPNVKYFFISSRKTAGAKRNMACNLSNGKIIIHWDDQDWYAHNWITHQVSALMTSGADISGLNLVQTFPLTNQKIITTEKSAWIYGATMVYWKSIWENHKFKELQTGEVEDFQQHQGFKIFAHSYIEGFNTNTYMKYLDGITPDDPLTN